MTGLRKLRQAPLICTWLLILLSVWSCTNPSNEKVPQATGTLNVVQSTSTLSVTAEQTPTSPLVVTPTSLPFLHANKHDFVTLNAITPIGSTIYPDETDYWVVGEQGFIVRYSGRGYPHHVDSPAGRRTLHDVDFVSPNDGWIVGEDELIMHWNGERWDIAKPATADSGWPYSYDLYNVAFSEENDGWAAGCVSSEGGEQILIYHWDGATWSQVSLPEELLLWICVHDIAAISPNDVWMVGTSWDEGKEHGAALHWDGGDWQSFSEGDRFVLHSISARSPDNIWAVTRYGIIWNWNGIEWSEKAELDSTGMEYPPVIFARESDDIFIAGNKIFHWDGINWIEVSSNSNFPADMNIVDLVAGPLSEGGNPFLYMLDSSGILYSFAKENFR